MTINRYGEFERSFASEEGGRGDDEIRQIIREAKKEAFLYLVHNSTLDDQKNLEMLADMEKRGLPNPKDAEYEEVEAGNRVGAIANYVELLEI